ncbi:ATPase family associated with various cellular activities (AAA) domain-containing protein [Hirsutella rhossiliensis]|uniref:ATPase family associated with various cellular activities (AAA) domain-containing protein n=1 Tax=Hirsutella rhossiliensis TaxID=111463 RepID=A0A9P8N4Z0_9HYPO|nr:ATPase family associated with various cellular activities (AAA) domain-containing protein [Hirsutella rhossiliensis]KAH0967708.1 ATPase family associated with various cellular activities (AAA) domain-containing protein [Hirsutella rhossiliensis]
MENSDQDNQISENLSSPSAPGTTFDKVFKGYRGITASLKSVVFKAPFRRFSYRWERLTKFLEHQRQKDPESAAFFQLLYDPVDAEPRESGYKYIVEAFVSGQMRDKGGFDEIVEGKGVSIVLLLAGNPGTGKALTAEAIADKVRRPLYMLGAGELGKDAYDVENRLKTVLRLAEGWKAILLFDECDVFLQQRQTSQLGHNEIVALFLRMIEHYRGILIMTSNRANTIDQGFHSRIHPTLHYPELDANANEHIWRRLTSHSQQGNGLTDELYRRLAQLPLNGRQIKNVIKDCDAARCAWRDPAGFAASPHGNKGNNGIGC